MPYHLEHFQGETIDLSVRVMAEATGAAYDITTATLTFRASLTPGGTALISVPAVVTNGPAGLANLTMSAAATALRGRYLWVLELIEGGEPYVVADGTLLLKDAPHTA